MGVLVVISIACFAVNYSGNIDNYNTTILALNYTYGFTSRGLIGTVFLLLDRLLPFTLMNAWGSLRFYQLSTVVFLLILFAFAYFILNRVKGVNHQETVAYLLIPLFICVVTSFANEFNFGRIDMYMIALSVLGAMLIVTKKAEWLVIVFSALGVMIHQGYVMMYFNIILVLLFYQFCSTEEKKEKIRYGAIFLISLVLASVLFLYFELFSHAENGAQIYDNVAAIAANLAADHTYHETLLAHEILGVDLSGVEHSMHMKNLAEIILFILCILPYLLFALRLFRNIYKRADRVGDKLKYLAIFLGSATMLPDFLIKVDYGRWVLAVVVYYFVIFACIITMDEVVANEVETLMTDVKQKYIFWPFLMIYPVLFVPFLDVNIDQITAIIGHVLNREMLHWW